MDAINNIFHALWTMSVPAELPGAWAGVPCHPSFRQLDEEPLQEVLDYFPPEELAAAGLVHREGNEVRVVATLQKLPTSLFFVRQSDKAEILQVIVGLRGLRPHMGALPALLHGSDFGRMIENWDYGPILTTSMSDLAIYTSLGIPALPATGLARINEKRLKVLLQLWESQFGAGWGPGFVLPECRLHDLCLHRNLYLEHAASQLGQFERLLNLDFDFRCWRPSPTTLSDLSFLIQNSSREPLSSAISRSLGSNESGVSVQAWTAEPHDLPSALGCWQRDLKVGDREASQESWKTVQRYLRQQIVEPFFQDALVSKPTERIRLAAAAPLLQGTFSRLFQLGEHINAQLSKGGPVDATAIDTVFNKAMELAKSIRELTGTAHARSR